MLAGHAVDAVRPALSGGGSRNLAFKAKQGEVTVVPGRNGVGKTTPLKSLMGVVPVKTGAVVLAGIGITHATPSDWVRLGIGCVPQGREILSRLTVDADLKVGLAVACLNGQRVAVIRVAQYDDFPADHDLAMERGEVIGRGRGLDMDAERGRERGAICPPDPGGGDRPWSVRGCSATVRDTRLTQPLQRLS